MKVELELADADSYTTQTLHRIEANLGAHIVVLGSFLAGLTAARGGTKSARASDDRVGASRLEFPRPGMAQLTLQPPGAAGPTRWNP